MCPLLVFYGQRNGNRHLLERHDRHARQFETSVLRASLNSVRLPNEVDRRLGRSKVFSVNVENAG